MGRKGVHEGHRFLRGYVLCGCLAQGWFVEGYHGRATRWLKEGWFVEGHRFRAVRGWLRAGSSKGIAKEGQGKGARRKALFLSAGQSLSRREPLFCLGRVEEDIAKGRRLRWFVGSFVCLEGIGPRQLVHPVVLGRLSAGGANGMAHVLDSPGL